MTKGGTVNSVEQRLAIGRDPFPIVTPRDMQVCCRGIASQARCIAQDVSGINNLPFPQRIMPADMQV